MKFDRIGEQYARVDFASVSAHEVLAAVANPDGLILRTVACYLDTTGHDDPAGDGSTHICWLLGPGDEVVILVDSSEGENFWLGALFVPPGWAIMARASTASSRHCAITYDLLP